MKQVVTSYAACVGCQVTQEINIYMQALWRVGARAVAQRFELSRGRKVQARYVEY